MPSWSWFIFNRWGRSVAGVILAGILWMIKSIVGVNPYPTPTPTPMANADVAALGTVGAQIPRGKPLKSKDPVFIMKSRDPWSKEGPSAGEVVDVLSAERVEVFEYSTGKVIVVERAYLRERELPRR